MSCTDGSDEIDAWIMRPADFDENRSYPVLLNVHGGPFTQYGEYYFDEAQMQAGAGYRGRDVEPQGRQRTRHRLGPGDHGPEAPDSAAEADGARSDVDDVMAVLDTTLEPSRSATEPGRHARWQLRRVHGDDARRPVRRPLPRHLLGALGQQHADRGVVVRHRHVLPVRARPEPRRGSGGVPAHVTDHDGARTSTCPMLIIHSEDDFRCPINQAEELWVTLRLLKRDVTLLSIPRREPRAVAQRFAGAPPDAGGDHPRLVRGPALPDRADDRRADSLRHPGVDQLASDRDSGRNHRQVVSAVPARIGDLPRISSRSHPTRTPPGTRS